MTFQYCFDGSIKKVNNLSVSSPRTWGCFQVTLAGISGPPVFPTHVGVFLFLHVIAIRCWRLPHARGGVSTGSPPARADATSSPRTWGCFYHEFPNGFERTVFPTHVGVFLSRPPRGTKRIQSSPRTWGCFSTRRDISACRTVFPTHVGVFPPSRCAWLSTAGLPHARGGVSKYELTLL